MTILVPVLGDQLSHDLASLKAAGPAGAVVLLMEVAEEATYVPHHPQKIALFFSAMRHFADELRSSGWQVAYVTIDDPANTGDFAGEVARAAACHGATRIVTVAGGEWRVLAGQQGWAQRTGLPVEILDDDRFLCGLAAFADWAAPRKRLIMEDFYRIMRRQTGLLMDGDQPAGGQWNYDADNRKSVPRGHRFTAPLRCWAWWPGGSAIISAASTVSAGRSPASRRWRHWMISSPIAWRALAIIRMRW